MDNLKAKGVKAFIWDFAGLVAGRGTTFLISIFLARLLTPADFGLVAMVMVFVGIAQGLADAGFSTALVQAKEVSQVSYSSVFIVNLIISGILGGLLYLGSFSIAAFYNNDLLVPLTQVLSLIFILNALNAVQKARLRRMLDFKKQTISALTAGILSGSIAIYMAYTGYGVWALVWQVMLNSIFDLAITWSLTRWLPFGKFKIAAIVPLWRFGRNLLGSTLIENIYQRLDYLIIGKFFASAELGLYGRAKSTRSMVGVLVSTSLIKVILPTISKIQDDEERINKIYLKLFELMAIPIFFLTFYLILNAENIFLLLFGNQWLAAVKYFQIMVLILWAYPLSALMVNIINARGYSQYFLRAEIIKKIFLLPAYIFAFIYGIEGYLWAVVIIAIPNFFINTFYLKKASGVRYWAQYKIIIEYAVFAIVSTVITVSVVTNLSGLNQLLLNSLVYLLLYGMLLFVFKRKFMLGVISQAKTLLQ